MKYDERTCKFNMDTGCVEQNKCVSWIFWHVSVTIRST